MALRSRDYAQAARLFRHVRDQYPQTTAGTDANFYLARTYQALQRYAEAAEAYQAFLQQRPGYIDPYLYEWIADNRFNAGQYQAAAAAYQAALQADPFPERVYGLRLGLARAYHLQGHYAQAIAAYRDLYQAEQNGYRRAALDWYIGQAYLAQGDTLRGHEAFLDAVDHYPQAYPSYQALLVLVKDGVPVNDLQRGLADYYAGQYGAAVEAFDRYLDAQPGGSAAAAYYKGLALRAMGQPEAALQPWDVVIASYPTSEFWDQAWEQKAYTQWAYLQQYDQATATLLTFVRKVPSHPRAAEFLFDAARVQSYAQHLSRAAALWERLAQTYPGSGYAFRSLYLAAITHHRLEEDATAGVDLQQALEHTAGPADVAAVYLWLGKLAAAEGKSLQARQAWEQAAAADPTGYYSERARDLAQPRAPFAPPAAYHLSVDWAKERQQAAAWVVRHFGLPLSATDLLTPGPLASDPRFIRGSELWRLGLAEEAKAEFEDLRDSVRDDPADTFRLAEHFRSIGLYRSAVFAARRVLDLAGMDDAATLSAPPYFSHLRFGVFYRTLVVPEAQARGFHPLFLFAVLRQESLFEGFVHSSAGARGLMQLMPATAEEIAHQLGWPPDFTADDLYRPKVSIVYGAYYLARQRDFLHGDLYAALAAYNAGPGNAATWLAFARQDPDLFLEIIPYQQTRDYIRRIYETFVIYRSLYGEPAG